jgi:hypothetical protein
MAAHTHHPCTCTCDTPTRSANERIDLIGASRAILTELATDPQWKGAAVVGAAGCWVHTAQGQAHGAWQLLGAWLEHTCHGQMQCRNHCECMVASA